MVKQRKQIKAYSVAFEMPSEIDYGKNELHKITIIAYNQEEAEDIFKKYVIGTNLHNKINYISAQTMLKTKQNAHMINKDFYEKQNAYVNKLFEKVNTK